MKTPQCRTNKLLDKQLVMAAETCSHGDGFSRSVVLLVLGASLFPSRGVALFLPADLQDTMVIDTANKKTAAVEQYTEVTTQVIR